MNAAVRKSNKLEFAVGDRVVHPSHGLGQIVSLEEQTFAGEALELYVISFEREKLTLRTPTNKVSEIGIYALPPPDSKVITEALKTIRDKRVVKKAMWSKRALEFQQKLNSGDMVAMAEVIRDTNRDQDDESDGSYSERQLKVEATERLIEIIAASRGTQPEAVLNEINDALVGKKDALTRN